MTANVKWVASVMESYAPSEIAYNWDNVGLLVGERKAPVSKVMTALELTNEIIDEAIEIGANMIVTHHPIMRTPINRVTDETILGQKIIRLIKNEIALFSAHTNLDIVDGGVNDTLFDILALSNKEPLEEIPNLLSQSTNKIAPSLGRIGELIAPMKVNDLIAIIKKRLGLSAVNYVGDGEKVIHKVGICTGSGSKIELLEEAIKKGCDTYISGDVTHHNAQAALELGIVLIDGTHFATEVIISDVLTEKIKSAAEKEQITLEVVKSLRQKSPLRQG